MKHREAQRLLYDVARGDLDQVLARSVEEHVAQCDRCFSDLQIFKETMKLVPHRMNKPSDERTEAYWTSFVDQIDDKTHSEKRMPTAANPIWDAVRSAVRFRRPTFMIPVGALAMAAVAALLWTALPGARDDVGRSTQVVGGVKADSVRTELADYFRRSKVLLVGISNVSMDRGGRVDLSAERHAARSLVRQARYLVDRAPDERSQELIKDLQRILQELANMEQQADLPDVEIVRSGMHQENILFKIRMAESEYSAPENNRIQ